MSKEKTIADVIQVDPKEMTFEARAKKYLEENKPITEKWGVTAWAGLQQTNEMLAAVPMIKDLWEKKTDETELQSS